VKLTVDDSRDLNVNRHQTSKLGCCFNLAWKLLGHIHQRNAFCFPFPIQELQRRCTQLFVCTGVRVNPASVSVAFNRILILKLGADRLALYVAFSKALR